MITKFNLSSGNDNCKLLKMILTGLGMLFIRFSLVFVFLKSGLNKWVGFLKFNPNTYDLFLYEFFCPVPAREGALRLCDKTENDYLGDFVPFIIERFANLAGIMEVLLSILLIVGLYSRFAAFGLLSMAIFIQLFVFTSTAIFFSTHIWWMCAALAIMIQGAGVFSLDELWKKFKK